jgi:hypothetical protein
MMTKLVIQQPHAIHHASHQALFSESLTVPASALNCSPTFIVDKSSLTTHTPHRCVLSMVR